MQWFGQASFKYTCTSSCRSRLCSISNKFLPVYTPHCYSLRLSLELAPRQQRDCLGAQEWAMVGCPSCHHQWLFGDSNCEGLIDWMPFIESVCYQRVQQKIFSTFFKYCFKTQLAMWCRSLLLFHWGIWPSFLMDHISLRLVREGVRTLSHN